MDRREFACNAIAIGGAVLSPRQVKWRQQATLRVDGRRVNDHLRELAEFGKNARGGISRVAYSEADVAGREYVMGLMRAAQLDPSIDAAGNIIGRRLREGSRTAHMTPSPDDRPLWTRPAIESGYASR